MTLVPCIKTLQIILIRSWSRAFGVLWMLYYDVAVDFMGVQSPNANVLLFEPLPTSNNPLQKAFAALFSSNQDLHKRWTVWNLIKSAVQTKHILQESYILLRGSQGWMQSQTWSAAKGMYKLKESTLDHCPPFGGCGCTPHCMISGLLFPPIFYRRQSSWRHFRKESSHLQKGELILFPDKGQELSRAFLP